MAALIRIGNSLRVRIPKTIIEQAHLKDKELNFKVTDDGLLIQPVKTNQGRLERAIRKSPSIQSKNGLILLDQMRAVDKSRLIQKVGVMAQTVQIEIISCLQELFAY
jgi:antitoxin component of MazEF toxin-antitoxin module